MTTTALTRPAGARARGRRPRPYRLDVHVPAGAGDASLADDVRAGLTDSPKWLLPKYLYDERGCELFEEITQLPEYYQTRAERSSRLRHASYRSMARSNLSSARLVSPSSSSGRVAVGSSSDARRRSLSAASSCPRSR